MKAALAIDKSAIYPTSGYELVIRNLVFSLVLEKPFYVLSVFFAKLGVVSMYFLIFAHGGIPVAFLFPKPSLWDKAFVFTFLVSMIFPLLAIPVTVYMASFITVATLFSVISINYALQDNNPRTILIELRKLLWKIKKLFL